MVTKVESFDLPRITELLSGDIPDVEAIEQDSNPEPWTRESFLEELLRPHSHLLVARISEGAAETTVAGYICFWLVADEVQILNVAVHPAYRRRGIGRALLMRCLSEGLLKKARKAFLEVRSSNTAAQRLYRSLGFREVGQRRNYYGELQEHATLMELNMAAEDFSGSRDRWNPFHQNHTTGRS